MRTLALTLTLLLCLTGTPFAFEVGAYFDLSTMDFARDRAVADTTLPGDASLWGLAATGSQELSDQISLELAFEIDPVLRNIAHTALSYRDQFFSITLGPFFGVFNAPGTILQSGLSTTVELYVPGVTVLTLRSDNSLSGRLVVEGDYIQERSELSVGFFVPNAIPSAYVRTSRYTAKTAPGESVDALAEYGIRTDIFQKNIPYGIVLDFAFHDRSRTFVEASTSVHRYGALVLGTEISARLFDRLSLLVDLESSIYMFGRDALLGTVSADRFLFRLRTGLSYRI